MKYILVSGGVLSGLGKGTCASSIGVILKTMGVRVTHIKCDPYLSLNAGLMNPFEHGECFVLEDGGEVDLDLGNYERFCSLKLTSDHNITTGKVYAKVIADERRGAYLGKTVQIVPHLTNAIQDWIEKVATVSTDMHSDDKPDVCVVELGGVIGDIESLPFVESLRQFQFRVGRENFAVVHVSLVPEVSGGEQKTKPTQHAVRELRSLGLSPDIICCRAPSVIRDETRAKIAAFCHVEASAVLSVHDVSNLYNVPLLLESQGISATLVKRLNLTSIPHVVGQPTMDTWKAMADKVDLLAHTVKNPVRVAFVGKYVNMSDAYKSVIKALNHAALALDTRVEVLFIESTDLEKPAEISAGTSEDGTPAKRRRMNLQALMDLESAHAVLVPGGYGERGADGKMHASGFARTSKVPFLGICLGMQLAVVEIARNCLGWKEATSQEFDEDNHGKPVDKRHIVMFMPEVSKTEMSGTMRLGSRETQIKDTSSMAFDVYKKHSVHERHRHRYEVNPKHVDELESCSASLRFTGRDAETGKRMEILELSRSVHPFFLGVQFHPEFLSHPDEPSPVFVSFIRAALEYQSKHDGSVTEQFK
jgi:CTP synthase